MPTALEFPPGEVEGGVDEPAPQPMATLVKNTADRIHMPSVRCSCRRCRKRQMPSKPHGNMKNPARRPFPVAGARELVAAGNPIVSVVDCAVLVAFPVMLAGLNEQVDPLGSPVHLNVTVPVKPSDENTERLTGMLWPALRVSIFGFAEREKSSPPVTLSSKAVEVLPRLLTSPE